MKKVIEDLAAKRNIFTSYSGTLRIMYLSGENVHEFIAAVREKYPTLAFQLKNQADVDAAAAREAVRKLKNKPKKIEPTFIEGSAKLPVEGTIYKDEEATAIATFEEGILPNPFLSDEIGQAEFVKEKKKPTFEEVDTYLLANPVDRKTKGPYDAAAAHFGVKTEYIRKRWSALREKGLVEKESETVNA